METNTLTRRALAAWYRSGGQVAPLSLSPGVVTHDGRGYVVLRDHAAVLAVYRVKPDGVLRRMRRWPSVLETAPCA